MARRRVTEVFPFLLPLRQWQRKLFFYTKMKFDGNKYAEEKSKELLPYKVYEIDSLMVNRNSGFDVKYQLNKVHNLKLAASTIDNLIIRPNETFSFWKLVRYADKHEPYKDGLDLINGEIKGSYGGGLCQLSNELFWMFLHTPLTIVERHSHTVQNIPSATDEFLVGVDATISEGWKDLKIKNKTKYTFQIVITFDGEYMHGLILSDEKPKFTYEIFNKNIRYYREHQKIIQESSIYCNRIHNITQEKKEILLYDNRCEIGYELPEGTRILEKGE
ncbi:MAG: glycopeptide resistance accessory protein VanW [Tissierellaceae bacterium]